jgi:class 3 adenylate cyclase/predicted ATPase
MDVGVWLRSLGLGQYEATFRDNEIDGAVLAKLTVDDLKDLGVVVVGHRRKIISAIEELNAQPVARTDAKEALPTQAFFPVSVGPDGAERRPITVMFCDLVGSTSLAAKLDAEDWRNLVNAYLDQASAAVADLGGHVLKKLGDGLMALFGYPRAQENDAERAVRAALAIQRALADLNAKNIRSGAPELSARIGIEYGSVVVDAAGEVFGEAPNVAARVQAAAEPGSVLITGSVQRQIAGLFVVEDKGAHELRGVAQPLSLYRVIRASGGGRRGGVRALTQFVGREEDIATLLRRWDRVRAGEGQFVQIVGEPGLGKSRLVEEFHARLGETPHTWVEWNSSQLLQNTPLHPVAEWGRARFGGQDVAAGKRLADLETTLTQVKLDVQETATLLAPLLDIPLPAERAPKFGPEELRRRQLAAMVALLLAGAKTQPVVLAFEDLHWADPTSLDLIQALAERGAQAPLLVVATARPEFRAPWGMRSHHAVVALAPLDRAEVRRMVGEIAAQHTLPQEVVERVSERTGGVPLFVEEVTRLLVERGAQGGVQAIPPTLQQSLAARLDRLGQAREVAQVGAVLGRDFVYALLRDIAEIDEPALQASLDRLADADLLFVEGAPPQANYRFKHALIQDAAYESLLKSRRRALHRRAAEALREANAEPEAIAHHFTEAGLDDLAIEWWGKAGDQALRRSAFQEAIAHLGKAIDMADKAADAGTRRAEAAAPSSQRLKLQTEYGQAVMWSRGYASGDSEAAFARARALAAGIDNAAERFAAYHGQWIGSLLRGEMRKAREAAETFLHEAESEQRLTELVTARRSLGLTCLYMGEFTAAQEQLSQSLADYDSARDGAARFRSGGLDHAAAAAAYLGHASWYLGQFERARALMDEAIGRAAKLAHPPTTGAVYLQQAILDQLRGDARAALTDSQILVQLGNDHGMALFVAVGDLFSGWARGKLDPKIGAGEYRKAAASYFNQGNKAAAPLIKGGLAGLEAEAQDLQPAIAFVDEGLALAQETGEHFCDVLLHRLRGEILLQEDPSNLSAAEEAYQTAIAIAKEQGARSLGLLAALSLAKLYQSTRRPVEAHAVLAPALEGFAPTSEMLEIGEGQALFAVLAETDEVRADASRRRQRTQLQVAYGNALIAARGLGALETAEAFSKARESATGNKDAPDRLAADYGLWGGSFIRGELSSMRAYAKDFLGDVDARPDSPEAGIANRIWGSTHHCAGEYAEALHHLKRALELFQPGRDDDLAFRFGLDAGVAAMACLALALWPVGEIDLAASLIQQMLARMASLTHVTTLAIGNSYAVQFAMLCGDRKRGKANASEFARLAREHNLSQLRIIAMFFEGWAKAENDIFGGLEDMRRSAELLREQKVLFLDGLVKIALAETEARTADPGRALAILDEALTTCEGSGLRQFEAELRRARGDILLKRDPANPLPAEEALRFAIVVARRQGTRSFELRAALALAKLYQSTRRPADAHTVLAPALEGLAPTDEMPEIAEAQALLGALAESDVVKAEAAQRQRLTQLQIAYGNALFAARGYGARETTEAFAKARESTSGDKDAPERLAADYGLWAGSLVRGELPSMRTHAAALLNDCEARPNSPEAGVAHRASGITCWFAGEYRKARDHLERALAMFQPGRDDELAFRLGVDPGTAAMAYLAITSWPLGEVDRARSLIERMQTRMGDLTHVGMLAYGNMHAALFEMIRGDPARAAPNVFELVRLADEHNLSMFRAFGVFLQGWAEGQSGSFDAGLEDMRRGVNLAGEQNALVFDGLFKIALAVAEARACDPGRGIAILDEALATHDRMGCRAFEAEQHRARGQILLKSDPANLESAENAFLTAIVVARRQATRSFEMRASLSLAKLYQSTERSADAHAILARALEGFSPTPEMPEIAEVQALLVARHE